jgi:hypothetical protein
MYNYLVLKNRVKKLSLVVLVFIFLLVMIHPIVLAYGGLGGLVSEKLLQGTPGNNSLTLGSGDASTLYLGMSGIVTTGEATDIDAKNKTVILHGEVTDMNGLPLVYAYFDWGYTSACGTSTIRTSLTSAGIYQITLSGYNSSKTIYYRSAIESDGMSYGSLSSFTSGKSVGMILLQMLATPFIALLILVRTAWFSDSIEDKIIGVIIGIVILLSVNAFLGSV